MSLFVKMHEQIDPDSAVETIDVRHRQRLRSRYCFSFLNY